MLLTRPLINFAAPVWAKDIRLNDELCPNVLVTALESETDPVLIALRSWAEKASPRARHVYWSFASGAEPHLILICGCGLGVRSHTLRKIEQWRNSGAFVIWITPYRSDWNTWKTTPHERGTRDIERAVSATIFAHPDILFTRPMACEHGVHSMARAAKGLLHPILFNSLICVDLADIRDALNSVGPMHYFSIDRGVGALMRSDPLAQRIVPAASGGILSVTYPDMPGVLRTFEQFVDSNELNFAASAKFCITLNLKQPGTPFEADLFLAERKEACVSNTSVLDVLLG